MEVAHKCCSLIKCIFFLNQHGKIFDLQIIYDLCLICSPIFGGQLYPRLSGPFPVPALEFCGLHHSETSESSRAGELKRGGAEDNQPPWNDVFPFCLLNIRKTTRSATVREEWGEADIRIQLSCLHNPVVGRRFNCAVKTRVNVHTRGA